MKIVAIIPARGGSRRIPRKNIREFFGKPIIAYSIEAALKSELFDGVMVSTDDDEIAEVAIRYSANIPFKRSQKNSDNHATINDVLMEVLGEYKKIGKEFKIGCCIMPIAPLLQQKYLKKGMDLLIKGDFYSVWPLVKFSYPIQRALKLAINGSLSFINKEFLRARSQDLEPVYHDAGQFYWFYSEFGINSNNCGGFEIKEMEVQDVDSEEDWQLLCLKYELMIKNKTRSVK